MISHKVICHLRCQAYQIAVVLDSAKPDNEKAVQKKALTFTLSQPRIDHICDENMTELYIKLFRTANLLKLEPTLPLSQFTSQGLLVKVKKENDLILIQCEY